MDKETAERVQQAVQKLAVRLHPVDDEGAVRYIVVAQFMNTSTFFWSPQAFENWSGMTVDEALGD